MYKFIYTTYTSIMVKKKVAGTAWAAQCHNWWQTSYIIYDKEIYILLILYNYIRVRFRGKRI